VNDFVYLFLTIVPYGWTEWWLPRPR